PAGNAVGAIPDPVTRARLHSHPGRVLLPSGLLRQPRFNVGAPPTVRKRSQTPTTEPAPFAPGAGAPTLPSPAPAPVSCRSTAHGAKAESNHTPRARPHSHPGRVLLPSGLLRQPRFHVGAPPTVRKRSQTPTTEPT